MKMANILLTCFTPSAMSCNDKLAGELISSVASDLHRLQTSLEESPPTLGWCSEAMLVVKKAHSHFLVYFERTKDCGPWEGYSTMVDDYMNVSLDLLDLCNLLKSALSGLDRRRMMVDFMVKTVKDASFMTTMTSKIELEKKETEKSNNLFKFRKWREMYLNKGTVSKVKMKSRTKVHILQPISSTMSIISLFVFYSVLHPFPIKIHEKFYSIFQNKNSVSFSVRKPGITFSTGRLVLHEKEMIEDALAAFTAELKAVKAGEDEGKLTDRLDELKNRSADLKQGIDLLESVLNELFEDVIKGRKKVMELITTNKSQLI